MPGTAGASKGSNEHSSLQMDKRPTIKVLQRLAGEGTRGKESLGDEMVLYAGVLISLLSFRLIAFCSGGDKDEGG